MINLHTVASVWQSYVNFAGDVQKNPKVAMTFTNMVWHIQHTHGANLQNVVLSDALPVDGGKGAWFLVHRGFLRELRGGRLRLNCQTTNDTNESKRNIKIHFPCVSLVALSVLRGEDCDLFFTTEGTEFTEKAETQ